VLEFAADQYGYVTTAQGQVHGVSADALRKMARRGMLERVSRGVYRVPTFPMSPYSEYMEATLWPAGVRGIISHQSALVLYGLSDVSPAGMHITVPARFRIRREMPAHLMVHHADIGDDEIRLFEGIPVTTPRRTIEDCHFAHVGPALLRRALQDAEREGYLSPGQVDDLRSKVLPGSAYDVSHG